MLEPATIPTLPDWKARKDTQWNRISGTMSGLQLIRSRQSRTQYMLVCSTDAFYEGVVIGQLPEQVIKVYGSALNPRQRWATEDEKPPEKRGIDLSDGEIDQVLARWAKGATAATLPFVGAVWDRSGKMKRAA